MIFLMHIPDQDEAKEAKKRIFGKGVAGGGGEHDDDGGIWKGSSARVCIFVDGIDSYFASLLYQNVFSKSQRV